MLASREESVMRLAVVVSLVTLVWIAGTGCGESAAARDGGDGGPPGDLRPREVDLFPISASRDLDLLFLIDDSPSMGDKQTNLINSLPRLFEVLGSSPVGLPNLRIGVATSDMGSQGAIDANPGPIVPPIGQGGCQGVGKDGNLQLFGATGMVGGDLFLSDVADPVMGRARNYSGALVEVLGRMLQAGDRGCAFEQHLAALDRALAPGNTINQKFLRPEANLGVIIVTDEDDCSVAHNALFDPANATVGPLQSFRCTRFGVTCDDSGQTPDEMNKIGPKARCHPNDSSPYLTRVRDHAALLKGLKADPARIVVAAIAGTAEPFATELRIPKGSDLAIPALAHSCTYIGDGGMPEVADPPARLRFFLDQFPSRNAFAHICQRDLSGGLQSIGDQLNTALGAPCIQGKLADVEPATPGTQYDCTVTSVAVPGVESPMPRCTPEDASATNKPCWHLTSNAAICPRNDHIALAIEGASALPTRDYVKLSCVIEPM